MSEPVLVPRGDGEMIADAPDRRVEILSDHESLHATWSCFGPGRDGADLHVHHHHTDLFYVLEGELTIRLGIEDKGVVVPAGTLACVPPLVVHAFRNGSDAEVRYLNLHAPGQGFADFLRALRAARTFSYDQHPPPPDGGRSPTEAVIGSDGFVAGGQRLLADVEEIGISEELSVPGEPSAPLHNHRRHVESFYVLEGEMTFTAGGRELRAEEGTWVQIPAGLPHTLAFSGNRPVRFLNLHTPNCGFGTFLRGLHEGHTNDALRAAFDQVPA